MLWFGARDVLAGRLDEKDAVQQIQQATRRFAKRQLTWFRKETGVYWLAGFGDAPEISAAALAIAIAAKIPCARFGCVEVRPILTFS